MYTYMKVWKLCGCIICNYVLVYSYRVEIPRYLILLAANTRASALPLLLLLLVGYLVTVDAVSGP